MPPNTTETTSNNPSSNPQRIVSLLGAATETLYRLGVGDKLVGRSHECDYPLSVLQLPCVSRPRLDVSASSSSIDNAVRTLSAAGEPVYKLDDKQLTDLQADLLITQDHCRVCAITPADVINSSCKNIKQLILRPANLQDCLQNVTDVAVAVGVPERGVRLRDSLEKRLDVVRSLGGEVSGGRTPRVALLEWCDPIMGNGYWLPELVSVAGGQSLHCPQQPGGATPSISFKMLIESKPDVVIFALCGFSLVRAAQEITQSWTKSQIQQLEETVGGPSSVFIVDGNYLVNRSGPRVVDSCEALAEAIHPKLQGHFGYYGTEYLSTLQSAIKMYENGVVTGSLKVRPDVDVEEVQIASEAETLRPTSDPKDAVREQLEHIRTKNMTAAFAMNSRPNQARWCEQIRFEQVLSSHATFARLFESVGVVGEVEDGKCINGSAVVAVDVVIGSGGDGSDGVDAKMKWTMVAEEVQGVVVWRTEKVGLC